MISYIKSRCNAPSSIYTFFQPLWWIYVGHLSSHPHCLRQMQYYRTHSEDQTSFRLVQSNNEDILQNSEVQFVSWICKYSLKVYLASHIKCICLSVCLISIQLFTTTNVSSLKRSIFLHLICFGALNWDAILPCTILSPTKNRFFKGSLTECKWHLWNDINLDIPVQITQGCLHFGRIKRNDLWFYIQLYQGRFTCWYEYELRNAGRMSYVLKSCCAVCVSVVIAFLISAWRFLLSYTCTFLFTLLRMKLSL